MGSTGAQGYTIKGYRYLSAFIHSDYLFYSLVVLFNFSPMQTVVQWEMRIVTYSIGDSIDVLILCSLTARIIDHKSRKDYVIAFFIKSPLVVRK